eukprot:TRINITY_DN19374_c0_g1_i1.p1 TRINITY_DN19374_c0_g1~~TRINITY_DN19374_c0_g1_i1.p1  ORF type:complete len:180 (+),score=6.17 TRINITY_DN19374_c0_g1_i1:6-545(+)
MADSKPRRVQGKEIGTPDPKAAPLKKSKPPSFKHAFDSPFTVHWVSLSEENRIAILEKLHSFFGTFKRAAAQISAAPDESEKGTPSAPKRKARRRRQISDVRKAFPELCLGFNELNKCLETDQLRLLVVCKDVTPPALIQHFPVAAFLKRVPLCPLANATVQLGKLFGVKSVVAFGVKV